MMTERSMNRQTLAERDALYPSNDTKHVGEPDPDTAETNIERSNNQAPVEYGDSSRGKELDAAMRQIGLQLRRDAAVVGHDNQEKIAALAESFAGTAELLSEGIVEKDTDKVSFQAKIIDALREGAPSDINQKIADELHAAQQQNANAYHALGEMSSRNDAIIKELTDRKFERLVALRDLSDVEKSGPVGAMLYKDIQFLDELINRNKAPITPPTRVLPTTAELEERLQEENLTPAEVSPARGNSLRSVAAHLIDAAVKTVGR